MRQKHLLKSLILLIALMAGGSAWAEEATIASFSYDSKDGWKVNADYATAGGGYYKLVSSDALIETPEIAWSNYSDITITISARKFGGPDATQGKISVSQGENELTSYSPSGTSIVASSALSISPVDGKITISCPGASSNKGCGVQSIVIKGTEKASASPLTSIALSGDYPTSFFVGDAYSTEGMTVTATYEDNSTKDVTNKALFSGYNMASIGQQEVTVSYTEGEVTKTASYDITVNELPKFTVTFSDGGSVTQSIGGASVTLPSRDDDGDYTFAGWSETNIAIETTTAPVIIPAGEYTPSADITLYPVYTRTEEGSSGVEEWVEIFAAPADGTYAICSATNFMKASINSSRFANGDNGPSISNGKLSVSPKAECQWYIYKATDGYYRIKNGDNFAGATGSNNQGALLSSETAKYAEWTISYSEGFVIENVDMASANKNKTLRNNANYGWGTYAASTGSAPRLFMKQGGITTTTYYISTPVADTRQEAGISFAEAAVTKEIMDNYTGQALTNPNNVSPIIWTSSDETVATVEDGVVTMLAAGETTITAKFDGNDIYKKATVSYTMTVQDSRQALELSFAETSVNVNITETVASPTLNGNTGNGAVTYESSDEAIATVDAATGEVTGVALGTATITATVAANNEYLGGTATFTVKVIDPNANDGSAEHPYTVAEARAAIDAGTGVTDVYATGIVSEIVTAYNSQYGNITYNISTDGTTTADQLQAYRGKSYNGDNFTSEDDIRVGDVVVIYGDLTKYNSTYEFAQNNQLVSLKRPADTTPSITVAEATVSLGAGENEGTSTITYTNLTINAKDDFGVQFYDAADEEIDVPSWIAAEVAEEQGGGYVLSYVIDANEGDARTAYLKVFASGDEDFVYSNKVTITQAKYVAPDVKVDPAEAGVGAFVKVTSTADITAGNYLIVYEGDDSHDAVAFNGGLQTLDDANNGIKVDIADGKIPATDATVAATFTILPSSGTIKSASGLYIGQTSNANGLASSDETKYENTLSIDEEGAVIVSGEAYLRYNSTSGQTRFRYYKSSSYTNQQAIQLYKYDETATPTITAKVTAAGYATFCSEYALDFSAVEGLTAYKATVTDKQVSFTKVDEVPARQGVLLKGNEGSYDVPVVESADEIGDNILIGVTKQTTVSETGIYVLMNTTEHGVGFYKTTNPFTLGAHTAYLPALSGEAGARSFIGISFGGTTGIGQVENGLLTTDAAVYNLQGQRVAKARKGLYIVGGKKMLVK